MRWCDRNIFIGPFECVCKKSLELFIRFEDLNVHLAVQLLMRVDVRVQHGSIARTNVIIIEPGIKVVLVQACFILIVDLVDAAL